MNKYIKAFAEKQMELSNHGVDPSNMAGFSFNCTHIINPFVDELARFEVDPYEYYGTQNMLDFTNSILEKATQLQEFYYAFAAYYDDLDNLAKRLQENYNDGVVFEQQEEDRLGLCYLLDMFDDMEGR